MNRNLLTLLLLALSVAAGFAGPVDLSKAQKAADNYVKTTLDLTAKTDGTQLVMATGNYYVFNIGTEGFVIISSDDVFRPVVGYSYEGAFPVNNPSPEMSYYLDNLSEGRQVALRASAQQSAEVAKEWEMLLNQGRLPSRNGNRASFYLCQTKWDQNDPYNRFCPTGSGGRSYAGCVATAMSQVMRYWEQPAQGQGSHSYFHFNYGEISANFGEATYNYELMPTSISGMSPAEQINAVAEFMYHCGVAVDMMYDPDGSGANSEDVPEAVMSYFGYSNRCRLRYRDDYSLEEFQRILKDQFDMGWPCYYSGTDVEQSAGHAFVCDGYDDNDMFHFNWGWSGSGNGFFVIDGLDVSGYGFNSGQAAVTNFVPSEVFMNTMRAPEFFKAEPNGDANFSVTLSWVNPKSTLDGCLVESIDQIILTRDGVVVMTFDDPVPGETVTYVDPAGLPVKVDYAVYAVYNGMGGRRAYADDINLGPTCQWTVKTSGDSRRGWGSGDLTIRNASGQVEGSFRAESAETVQTVVLPQGWISFWWTAPTDSLEIGIDILDSEDQTVFSYQGPSTLMPEGLFFETVNTCGGEGSEAYPSNLQAQVVDEDVVLQWTGIGNPGYGYNIYRDGFLYTMVADTTGYTDKDAASVLHSYYVTAFREQGETYPSNTVCAITENAVMCPRDFDYTFQDGNKIEMTWTAPEQTEDFVGYRIYRKAAGEDYKLVKSMGTSYTSFVSTLPEEGKRFCFKIVAMYDHGHVESAPAHALHNPDMLYLEVNLTHIPSNLTLQEQEGALLLAWDPAWRAESYNLYRNGELIVEGITELNYTDSIASTDKRRVYQVTGLFNGVESSPSNKVVFGNTGLQETAQEYVRLYPNPTSGNLVVEGESLETVTVYNLAGQQILCRQANQTMLNIDLSALESGVYLVKVITQKGIYFRKVVLKK